MGHRFGGEYYCHSCKYSHQVLGKIGKAHIGFASEGVQREVFRKYGIGK